MCIFWPNKCICIGEMKVKKMKTTGHSTKVELNVVPSKSALSKSFPVVIKFALK